MSMSTKINTVYIPEYSARPPPLKTKKQLRIEINTRYFKNVINIYKESRALKQYRRNNLRKLWIYTKLKNGEKITNNDQNVWKQMRMRLNHLVCNELSYQLKDTRHWLKLRESGCARILNFYPGARKLNF